MPSNNKPIKKQKKFSERYPPLYFVGNVPIRVYNIISIHIGEINMKKLVTLAQSHEGLSVAKILAHSGKPCECCKDKPVLINHNGTMIAIPRGLLSASRTNSGSTITKKKRNGK